jgi:hypothetical protein
VKSAKLYDIFPGMSSELYRERWNTILDSLDADFNSLQDQPYHLATWQPIPNYLREKIVLANQGNRRLLIPEDMLASQDSVGMEEAYPVLLKSAYEIRGLMANSYALRKGHKPLLIIAEKNVRLAEDLMYNDAIVFIRSRYFIRNDYKIFMRQLLVGANKRLEGKSFSLPEYKY